MKKTFLQSTLRIIIVLCLLVGMHNIASAESTKSRRNRIVGLWDVQVTIFNCITGAQIGGFTALHKYELGGTGQVVPATNPAALSAHMTTWSYVSNDDYLLNVKMFRFDPTGINIGYNVIRANISIDEDATQYSGSAVAEFFDANGNSLGTVCPAFTGTRFQ